MQEPENKKNEIEQENKLLKEKIKNLNNLNNENESNNSINEIKEKEKNIQGLKDDINNELINQNIEKRNEGLNQN